MVEKEKKENTVVVAGIRTKMLRIKLVGTSPLISHKFSDAAKDKIIQKQGKTAKTSPGREAKDPQKEYEGSLYVLEDGRYGFPLSAFKNAAVDACSFTDGITKVLVRGAFHLIDEKGGGLLPIKGSPRMRTDNVRVGMGAADIRYRAEFPSGWMVELPIIFNENAVSADQIVQLFNTAGFAIGVGDWRPQKDGSYGMFKVVSGD